LEINIVCVRIRLGSDNARIGSTRTSNLTSGTKGSLTGLGLWELGLDAGSAAIGVVFATVQVGSGTPHELLKMFETDMCEALVPKQQFLLSSEQIGIGSVEDIVECTFNTTRAEEVARVRSARTSRGSRRSISLVVRVCLSCKNGEVTTEIVPDTKCETGFRLEGEVSSITTKEIASADQRMKLHIGLGRDQTQWDFRRIVARDDNVARTTQRVDNMDAHKATGTDSVHSVLVSSVDSTEVTVFQLADKVFEIRTAGRGKARVKE
jgi:hypothetical protein